MDTEMQFLIDRIKSISKEANLDDNVNAIISEGETMIELYKNKKFPDTISDDLLRSFVGTYFRELSIKTMGFPILTNEFLDNLSKYIGDKKCLEVMSGKGSLAKGLMDRGVDIKATDDFSWKDRLNLDETWIDIENIDCIEAIKKYGKDIDFLICSWIPMSDIGYEIIKTIDEINPKCKTIVIGESKDGCTASDLFFDNIDYIVEDYDPEINPYGFDHSWYIVNAIKGFKSWYGIHDEISIVKLKKNVEEN